MKTSTFSTSGSTISAIVAGLTLAGSISAQPLTIDKELLSGIVQAKQEEIKARFMGDLVRKNIRTTNNTTYNTLYDLVDVLLTEKNSTRMTEAIVHKVADYGVTYMATWYFIAKEGPQTIVTAKDTIKLNGRPFDALTKLVKEQYEEQRKGTDHFAPGIRIDQDTPFLIGYVNWLMDEMYDSLKVKAGLKKRGLYLSDPERKWQKLHGPDYPGFWNAHDPSGSLRQSILLTLKAFCMKVDSGVVELGTIADSVGLYGNTDVWNMLDLRTLAAPKGKAGEASTESQPDQMVRSFWGNDVAIQDGASGNKRVELIFELFQHSV
ncbi:MAG: hypothetical protein IPL64_04205 [Flavobacteriales bacterium]|nr:hypothetical protein [Flavobacteriales bacterium]